MKTKTFFLTTLMFLFLLICSAGMHAQTAKLNLDQVKLAQQALGTWESTSNKDTVVVVETQQYGKSFIRNVSLVIKGTKSPYYIANYCFDSNDGKFKGFNLYASGSYATWIGLWTTEKRFRIDIVQNFKPETVLRTNEHLFETPTSLIATRFNKDGVKAAEAKYKKVK